MLHQQPLTLPRRYIIELGNSLLIILHKVKFCSMLYASNLQGRYESTKGAEAINLDAMIQALVQTPITPVDERP